MLCDFDDNEKISISSFARLSAQAGHDEECRRTLIKFEEAKDELVDMFIPVFDKLLTNFADKKKELHYGKKRVDCILRLHEDQSDTTGLTFSVTRHHENCGLRSFLYFSSEKDAQGFTRPVMMRYNGTKKELIELLGLADQIVSQKSPKQIFAHK